MNCEDLEKNRIFCDSDSDEMDYFNDDMDDVLNKSVSKFEAIRETPKFKRKFAPRNLLTSIENLEPFHTPKSKSNSIIVNNGDNSKSSNNSSAEIERKKLQAIIRLKDFHNNKRMKNFMTSYFFDIETWPINILRHFLAKKLTWKGVFDLASFFYGNGIKSARVVERIITFYNEHAKSGWKRKLDNVLHQIRKLKTFEENYDDDFLLGPVYCFYCMKSDELVYIDDKIESSKAKTNK